MNNNRKISLKQIIKEAELNKIADNINNQLADVEDPEEYAHQVFLKLLENVKIDGLDD